MKTNPHVAEIRELNLGYLLLAQRLLQHDRAEAMFRLKIDDEMADLLAALNVQQLSRLANTNQLLCHFGAESAEQLRQVVDNPRDQGLSHIHASLLMASRSMLSEGGEHVG
ncbi:flagellar transcriptional regulator FlhD [Halomonas sp. HG01]|uniref:flagellar transcriptional regulator FlhD n=1 Tax=Halomonas sp. HG01 TaxID=1609967 RepID=UPI0006146667|nr:flagellar transcriptional regulator FlhD [Halomonas sp. HG01]